MMSLRHNLEIVENNRNKYGDIMCNINNKMIEDIVIKNNDNIIAVILLINFVIYNSIITLKDILLINKIKYTLKTDICITYYENFDEKIYVSTVSNDVDKRIELLLHA